MTINVADPGSVSTNMMQGFFGGLVGRLAFLAVFFFRIFGNARDAKVCLCHGHSMNRRVFRTIRFDFRCHVPVMT